MEELFDKELQGMVRFTDATKKKAKDKPADAQWEPVKVDPDWIDRLKDCAKWVALFGGLSILFFYWQQTGQMKESAAVPSMCVCALMAGVGVGRNWWR